MSDSTRLPNHDAESRSTLATNATAAVTLLCGKWAIRILVEVSNGPVRTAELCARIPEATKKVVIDSLQKLEAEQLVQRIDLSTKVKHVEYMIPDSHKDQVMRLIRCLAEFPMVRTD